MHFQIFLTHKCNLNCIYCGEESIDSNIMPKEIDYPISQLKEFIIQDPDPVILFYGGEPLLKMDRIKEIINIIEAKFVIQTNGLLINNVPENILTKLDAILVSIDGRKQITDYYRGKGTYKKIIQNISTIRERGFKGDLIARMTVSNTSNIFEEVIHLLKVKKNVFDHIHWQLDVIWSPIEKYGDFSKWTENYNTEITKLIDYWFKIIDNENRILGIAPFLGIMYSLLMNKPASLRCEAGENAFAIQTNGKIYACPICPDFKDFIVGDIRKSRISEIKDSLHIGSPCTECEYLAICGGRCLFANKYYLDWGIDGFKMVCKTVTHLIDELNEIKPEIEELIGKGIFRIEDFHYPKYNNSVEIIP